MTRKRTEEFATQCCQEVYQICLKNLLRFMGRFNQLSQYPCLLTQYFVNHELLNFL